MSAPGPIPVYAVEDDARVLRALNKLLSASEDVRLVGTAASGESALAGLHSLFDAGEGPQQQPARLVQPERPRVVLMDIELPGQSGIETTRVIKQARLPVEILALTSFDDEDHVFEAMRAGASGYVVKGASAASLLQAIRDVDAGGTVIEPRLAKRFWDYFRGVQAPAREEKLLSEMECEILFGVAKGLSNAEVGGMVHLDRRTVRTHLGHIYAKLGVRTHVEAVVEALKRGLIQL